MIPTASVSFAAPAAPAPASAPPSAGSESASAVAGIRVPAVEAEIMPLDQVRVGMRGYGRSVFSGTAITTFPVVVRSVVSDSSAGRGTVWIECTDERMARSGPVQGMSGSPIYLWEDGEVGTDGEGGRLIGAFAFGYSDVNVCLVGVQPIAYMREVGAHAVATEAARRADPDGEFTVMRGVGPDTLARGLNQMIRQADAEAVPPRETAVLRALAGVVEGRRGAAPSSASLSASTSASGLTAALGGHLVADAGARAGSAPHRLALPVSVGSAEAARWLAPALAPAGLAVRAGGATARGVGPLIAGTPPSNVPHAADVKLEPGSVLSIPLAWGDLDLNASGTVTEVRPDGTVLAFGHAMNAVGAAGCPSPRATPTLWSRVRASALNSPAASDWSARWFATSSRRWPRGPCNPEPTAKTWPPSTPPPSRCTSNCPGSRPATTTSWWWTIRP